jgi:hypothetical protein
MFQFVFPEEVLAFPDQSMRHFDVLPSFDVGVLSFQLFIDGKEVFHFAQNMRRETTEIFDFLVSGAGFGDG